MGQPFKCLPDFQSGGLMDYAFYGDLIPDALYAGQEPPAEAVAGSNKASQGYDSGLMVSVYAQA